MQLQALFIRMNEPRTQAENERERVVQGEMQHAIAEKTLSPKKPRRAAAPLEPEQLLGLRAWHLLADPRF